MKFTEFGFDAALESTLDGFESESTVLESFNNFASLMDDNTILSEEIAMESVGQLKAKAQIFWQALKDFIAKAISSIRDLLKKKSKDATYKNVGEFIERYRKLTDHGVRIFRMSSDLIAVLAGGKSVDLDPLSDALDEFTQTKEDLYKKLNEADINTARIASGKQFEMFENLCGYNIQALQALSNRVEAISKKEELASNSIVQSNASSIIKKCTYVSKILTECFEYGSKKCAV